MPQIQDETTNIIQKAPYRVRDGYLIQCSDDYIIPGSSSAFKVHLKDSLIPYAANIYDFNSDPF